MREHVRFDPTKGIYVSKPCRATSPERCPFYSDNSTKHFETREEARQYVESMNEKISGERVAVKRTSKKTPPTERTEKEKKVLENLEREYSYLLSEVKRLESDSTLSFATYRKLKRSFVDEMNNGRNELMKTQGNISDDAFNEFDEYVESLQGLDETVSALRLRENYR